MRRLPVILLIIVFWPGQVEAQVQERQHTVVRGETLWGLAERFCDDPFLWPEIYDANRNLVTDPDLIYPGQDLAIACAPAMDAPPPRPEPGAMEPEAETEPEPQQEYALSERDRPSVFRRDAGLRVASELDAPDFTVMSRDHSWSAAWMDRASRSLAMGEVTELLSGKLARTAMPYQRIRVTSPHRASVGDVFQVAELAETIEGVGDILKPTGMVSVVRVEEGGFEGVVLKSYGRVVVGDLVVPAPDFDIQVSDRAVAVSDGATARILAFGDSHALQQMGDIAILNRGSDDGVALGDEYVLMTGASEGWSGRMAGRLQVVRVTPGTASARIVRVEDPIFEAGLEVVLDRKMR